MSLNRFFSEDKDELSFSQDSEDYIVVTEDPSTTNRYYVTELDSILATELDEAVEEKKYSLCEILKSENGPPLIKFFEDVEGRKIALFRAVVDNPPRESRRSMPGLAETLDLALKQYCDYLENNPDVKPCRRLVIPIAELVRRHFQLLVIDPLDNRAECYDSRTFVLSRTYKFFSSVLASRGSIEQFHENYDYIMNTCKKYFPEITFEERALGHQSICNDNDCGPLVVEYAKNAIKDQLPPPPPDIEKARAEQRLKKL